MLPIMIFFALSTHYFSKDLFFSNLRAHASAIVFTLTSMLWWAIFYSKIPHDLKSIYWLCASVGYLFGQLLLFIENTATDQHSQLKIVRIGAIIWGFFVFQCIGGLMGYALWLTPILIKCLTGVTLGLLMGVFYFYLPSSRIPFFNQKISLKWASILVYATVFLHSIMGNLTNSIHAPALMFFGVYALFFTALCTAFPIRMLRLALYSFSFSALSWLLINGLYWVFTHNHIQPYRLTCIFIISTAMPWAMTLCHAVFDRVIFYINQCPPFSVIDHKKLMTVIDALKPITRWVQLSHLISGASIFKSSKHAVHLWEVNTEQPSHAITTFTPSLDPDIIMFLQYKGSVNIKDEKQLLVSYFQRPFHSHVRLLLKFMDDHNLIYLTLVQKSHQMLGILGVSFNGSRHEILNYDIEKISFFKQILSYTMSNIIFYSRRLTQEQLLSSINLSATQFDSTINSKSYYKMIRSMLATIIPNISFYALLTYDQESQFYNRSFLLNQDSPTHFMTVHSKTVEQIMGGQLYFKVILSQDTPPEIQSMMNKVKAEQVLFIRLNESHGSDIFMLFFEKKADVLDYRISFCHMFLRQSDIFYQYQMDCNQYNELQLFLKQLLDQLPTGILIATKEFGFHYMNLKMSDQTGIKLRNGPTSDVRSLNLFPCIINAIDEVSQKSHAFHEKVELPFNNRDELFSLSAFQINQGNTHDYSKKCPHKETAHVDGYIVVVLTNIQQSKELIDQMNQTNRLAMMSKIAKGISYELNKPVAQLIQGVEKIETEWQGTGFQNYFLTDIIPQVDRINLLCQSLLRLSRSNKESLVEVYLPDLLDQVFRLIAGDLRVSTQKFYIGFIQRESIIVDQVMAIQVLMNLMIFCLKSLTQKNSRLSLDIMISESETLMIDISIRHYNPSGFSDNRAIKEQLELSIVNQIVVNQSGTFDVFCEDDSANFHVTLPIKQITQMTASTS